MAEASRAGPVSTFSSSVVCRVSAALLICSCLLAVANQTTLKSHFITTAAAGITVKHAVIHRDVLVSHNYTANELASTGTRASKLRRTKVLPHAPIDLHLPKFPSLKKAFNESQIVAVYFGASWCKQSARVVKKIDRLLGPKLQQYAKETNSVEKANGKRKKRRPLTLLYVSSDKSKLQFQNFVKNRFWKVAKWKSERKELKKHFKVCAKIEQEPLQLQREYEIPHMILFSGRTHRILSRDGVHDLETQGLGILDHWMDLEKSGVASAS
ncbi:expressed unknown protein [Seminavis robusta]|uniref:Thioredoxin-like fold domain-containing protein n=1 Tax=Seminavis robusta TaxID=568900 RepID=A0A9N8D4N4_9STRA|nr:expressed unknown protein [Seminavis robusta]|eukprot:Sro4_g003130.1 n/a (269) ;mRNA; f:53803-54609